MSMPKRTMHSPQHCEPSAQGSPEPLSAAHVPSTESGVVVAQYEPTMHGSLEPSILHMAPITAPGTHSEAPSPLPSSHAREAPCAPSKPVVPLGSGPRRRTGLLTLLVVHGRSPPGSHSTPVGQAPPSPT